jgi:hypothetical protein
MHKVNFALLEQLPNVVSKVSREIPNQHPVSIRPQRDGMTVVGVLDVRKQHQGLTGFQPRRSVKGRLREPTQAMEEKLVDVTAFGIGIRAWKDLDSISLPQAFCDAEDRDRVWPIGSLKPAPPQKVFVFRPRV